MARQKLSTLNIIQFVITIAAVLFGIYAMINTGTAEANTGITVIAPEADGGESSSFDPGVIEVERVPDKVVIQEPSETPLPVGQPEDQGEGVIDGTVSFSNGKPVGDIRVTATNTGLNINPPKWDTTNIAKTRKAYDEYFRRLQANTRVTTTDSKGRFQVTGLDEDANYTVTVGSAAVGQTSQVSKPGKDLDFVFDVPVLIKGVVSAKKLPDSYTVIVETQQKGRWWTPIQSGNFSGKEFEIKAQTGNCRVRVTASGYVQAEPSEVQVGDEGAEISIELSRAAIMFGKVTGNDGEGLQGVSVMINDGNMQGIGGGWEGRGRAAELEDLKALEKTLKKAREIQPAMDKGSELRKLEEVSRRGGRRPAANYGSAGYTNQSGDYRIENIVPGSYTVTIRFGTITDTREVTLAEGENRQDFILDTGNRVTVTGATSSGEPVTPSYVYFYNSSNQYVNAVQQQTGKEGQLEYIGVPDGTYKVMAAANGYAQVTQEDVYIGGGSAELQFTFEEPAKLSGRITTGSGKIPERLYVTVTPSDREGAQPQWISVDKEGKFTSQALTPGSYDLVVQFNQNDVLHKEQVWLSSGDNETSVALDEQGTLTVTVDPSFKNVKSVNVSITSMNREGQRVARYAQMDENNQAFFSFLPEGEYYVGCYVGSSNVWEQVSIGRGSHSVTLKVGPSNSVKITAVSPDFQAGQAGMQVGDIITYYNGAAVKSLQDLVKEIAKTSADDNVTVTAIRNGRTMTFSLKGGRMGINGSDHHR